MYRDSLLEGALSCSSLKNIPIFPHRAVLCSCKSPPNLSAWLMVLLFTSPGLPLSPAFPPPLPVPVGRRAVWRWGGLVRLMPWVCVKSRARWTGYNPSFPALVAWHSDLSRLLLVINDMAFMTAHNVCFIIDNWAVSIVSQECQVSFPRK